MQKGNWNIWNQNPANLDTKTRLKDDDGNFYEIVNGNDFHLYKNGKYIQAIKSVNELIMILNTNEIY
jgi:hypothetical protein